MVGTIYEWQIIISNLGFYSLFTVAEEVTLRETGCLKPLDRPIVDLGVGYPIKLHCRGSIVGGSIVGGSIVGGSIVGGSIVGGSIVGGSIVAHPLTSYYWG